MINPNEKLEQLRADLARRIKASPRNSPTARAAQDQLDWLASPSCALTTAQKVKELRTTIRNYRHGLAHDNSHHGPNLGPETNPRPPQRP